MSNQRTTHKGGDRQKRFSKCNKTCIIHTPIGHTSASHLKTLMMVHMQDKPHKCEQCAKSFSQAGVLKTHLITHFGEKPYKCGQCNFSAKKERNLKTHIMNHGGEKIYNCAQCGKSFNKAANLKAHMLIHTALQLQPMLRQF